MLVSKYGFRVYVNEVTPLTQFERTSLLSLFWFYKDKNMFILGFFYGSAKCDLFMGLCSL